MAAEDKASAQDAYIYGRFGLSAPKAVLALDGTSAMGFVFKCDGGVTYTVRFRVDNDVQLLRVKPSTCSLDEMIFTNQDGQVRGRKPSPPGAMKFMKLEAGNKYYVGDFHGAITFSATRQEWQVDSAHDRFATTTDALKLRFPAFADFPARDMMSPDPR